MPCFPMFLCLFFFWVDVGVTCSYVFMMLLAMPCLDICVSCIYFHAIWLDPWSSHAYMLVFMFFHVHKLSSYMFTGMFLCLYV